MKITMAGSSQKVLASVAYTRDSDGQVKSIATTGLPGTESLSEAYDINNRLEKSGSIAYAYDSGNNPTTLGSNTSVYDAANELKTSGSNIYGYDQLGERVSATPKGGQTTIFGYDQAGNLIQVKGGAINDTYAYNGNGLRASQTKGKATSYITWDMHGELPLILSDEQNSYVYGPDNIPIEQIQSKGAVLYLHHDQQGSIRMLTNATGTTEATTTYDAYGNLTGATGTATSPLGYDGQYTNSDTGLVYLRVRSYDPATAQFLTVDPIVGFTLEPYNYTHDNPLNYLDRTGLFPSLSIITGTIANTTSEAAGGIVHVGLDLAAIVPYGVYYVSYNTAKGINSIGCAPALGPLEPATCAVSHVYTVPFAIPEAVGLGGDILLDEIKGESVCDEGKEGYINPLHSFVPSGLRGPEIYLPGVHPNGSVDFEW